MPSNPIASSIDAAIEQCYRSSTLGGAELRQLRRLFDPAFTSRLQQALQSHCTRQRETVSVTLHWIDKRPYAELMNKDPKTGKRPRGELGDAVVFFHYKMPNVRPLHWCLLLQAKITKSGDQALLPLVPVTTGPSTDKEITLYSLWPTFELYEHAHSGTPLLPQPLQLCPSATPPTGHGWFMATPGPGRRLNHGKWRSAWMCGPADPGAPCDVTLGELLGALFGRVPLNKALPAAGVEYSQKGTADWDRLCAELERLAQEDRALRPASWLRWRLWDSTTYAGPLGPVWAAFRAFVNRLRAAWSDWRQPPMPVLIITHEMTEPR